jgi:mannose-1-phosphate guanylyltransferase/mannose-1-phosphate guanylyltransferase/mannose-6-phosphate isomerase
VVHRIQNPEKIPLEVIEVQTGDDLGDGDTIRLEAPLIP